VSDTDICPTLETHSLLEAYCWTLFQLQALIWCSLCWMLLKDLHCCWHSNHSWLKEKLPHRNRADINIVLQMLRNIIATGNVCCQWMSAKDNSLTTIPLDDSWIKFGWLLVGIYFVKIWNLINCRAFRIDEYSEEISA
jgi:hypothetical protein